MLSEHITSLLRNPETPSYAILDAIQDEGSKVASVWVVYGESISYSDYRTWTVAAFLEEGQAKRFRDKLRQWTKENYVMSGYVEDDGTAIESRVDYVKLLEKLAEGALKCPLDPLFEHVDDGVGYNIWEMPLKLEES